MDDEALQEAYAAVMELKLQVMMLEKERDTLKTENKQLKENIQHVLLNESMVAHKMQRRLSPEAKDKWMFYHEHKNNVKDKSTWWEVKRETDKMYFATTTTQRT